jgi:signal transduction histidine kinase
MHEPAARGARRAQPPRLPLQLEIVASLLVVMLGGLAIVAAVVGGIAAANVEREALGRLELGARQIERLRGGGTGRLADVAALLATLDRRALGASFHVHDAEGRAIWSARPRGPADPELAQRIAEARARGPLLVGGGFPPDDLRYIAPIEGSGGEPGAVVGIVSAQEFRARLLPLLWSLGWVLSIAALVFVAFGAYLLRYRIVLPLLRLTATADRIGAGELSARVVPGGPEELAQLGERMNEMVTSLERERRALVEAEASLARSERLASVGRLSAGVAHEVGNPVAAILGYAEVASRDGAAAPRTREVVARIRDEALRIRALVRELLDLGRGAPLEVARLEPGALVERLAERLRPQPLLAGIALETRVEPGLPAVVADSRRIEQVLVNLIENAAHALRGAAARRIELAAVRARLPGRPERRRDDPPGAGFSGARRSDAVAFLVEDCGPGIDAEHLPHVFDPFFTTKQPGEGTGLGLWNAHRIAELHGGAVQVESAPGRTRFSLILPVADQGNDGHASRPDHR